MYGLTLLTRFYTADRIDAMSQWVGQNFKTDCQDCKMLATEIIVRQPKKRIDAAQGFPVSQEEQDAYQELASIFVWHHASHFDKQ